jgi:hypothetical protein
MVPWPPMDAAPESSSRALGTAASVLAALVGATLLAAAFAGDASDVDGILPVGGFAVVLLGGALVVVALGRLTLPRLGAWALAMVVVLLVLVTWVGVTVSWSIAPDRSWEAFNRSVAFAAFLGLGLVLAATAGRVAARVGASVLALVTGVVLTWALLAKVVPALDPDGDRVARLREPVGYWNALALLADVGLVLGLWLGASRGHRTSVRVAGALLCYVATLALLLTLSRVGVVAGVAVVLLWLVLSSERVEGGLLLAASALPAALVGAWAFMRPALVEDVATRSDRAADGAVLGVLALAGAGLVVVLVVLGTRRSLGEDGRRRASRLLVVAAGLAAVVAVVGVGFALEDAIADDVSCTEVVNDPSRLRSADLSNRWCWWNEAWDVFAGNAPEGAGAGSFVVARKRYREDARNVVQPHSVPLQHLADGGVVGLGLFLALLLAAAVTCVCAVRRLDGAERAASVALVAVPAAYLLHSLVDYDWDFLAVTAPTMVALGVLAGAGRPVLAPSRRPLVGVAAVLVALAVLVSFSSPRLSERNARASTRALDDDLERARDLAERARDLNPLSAGPIFSLARVAEREGLLAEAQARYIEAVELQPENPATWYALGLFEFQVRENMCAAYQFLNNAYTLDPVGQQWFPGGELDIAREAVDAGACERP